VGNGDRAALFFRLIAAEAVWLAAPSSRATPQGLGPESLKPSMHAPAQQPCTVPITGPVAQGKQPSGQAAFPIFQKFISNFQNSYLLNFKPKFFKTSAKTSLISSSIYLNCFSYYVLY
jgi:hypothetical protein